MMMTNRSKILTSLGVNVDIPFVSDITAENAKGARDSMKWYTLVAPPPLSLIPLPSPDLAVGVGERKVALPSSPLSSTTPSTSSDHLGFSSTLVPTKVGTGRFDDLHFKLKVDWRNVLGHQLIIEPFGTQTTSSSCTDQQLEAVITSTSQLSIVA
jgi:hypothetical protein